MTDLSKDFATTWTEVWAIALTAVAIVAAIVAYSRIAGLRSFSKMSTYDFAITVAFGSIVGGVVLFTDAPLLNGLVALGALFGSQALFAVIRRTGPVGRLVDNRPLVLMVGSRIIDENLRRARVTEDDVRAKLREANVLNLEQVRAVVLEQTGDISVLHGDTEIDMEILKDVRGADRLRTEAERGGDLESS